MFRALFFAIVFATLAVNLILLFATKDKPPDGQTSGSPSTRSTFDSVIGQVDFSSWQPAQRQPGRRLFLRSNDLYDYTHEYRQAGPVSSQSSDLPPPSPIPAGAASHGRRQTESDFPNANTTSAGPDSRQLPSADGSRAATDASRRRVANSTNTLAIRVKSSKNHVLIKVDNLIIYESGGATEADPQAGRRRRTRRRLAAGPSSGRGWRVQPLGKEPTDGKQVGGGPRQIDVEPEPDRDHEPDRGLHVLVLNQFEGFVMSQRRFDTYTPGQDEELALYLSQVQPGRLLVLAVQDEASFKMARSSQARKLIAGVLGSRLIMQLDWRDMWALVAVKRLDTQLDTTNRTLGGRAGLSAPVEEVAPLAEGLSKSRNFVDWAPPVELEVNFQLVPGDEPAATCQFESDSDEGRARRRHFCQRIEGYGRVCDCSQPSRIEFAPRPIANSQLAGVPIVVVASNRPHYLYRMLRSLLQADGVEPELVTVFIDGFYEEPRALCQLLAVRYVQARPEATRSARISHHYKASLTHTFGRLFPAAELAIILEEDLDLARDGLIYFNQTRRLLESDSSLYCVSAWNDQGYEHSAGDTRQLLRVETMPGLGWMLTRRLFEDELRPEWPSSRQQHDWDMWIRTPAVRRGRECIIPEVSRTFHFGSQGTNINSYFQQQYFSKHAFSDFLLRPGELAQLQFAQLGQLDAAAYDMTIERLLSGAEPQLQRRWFTQASHNDDPHQSRPGTNSPINETLAVVSKAALCALASESNESESGSASSQTVAQSSDASTLNVIFIKMIDGDDFASWLRLAKCWRLWDLDARGQHKSMWRLRLRNQPTLVIGHPASPFSRRKPNQVLAYDLREPPV